MDHLNHPGNFFFLTIERWTCQNFHFLQKTIEKSMFFCKTSKFLQASNLMVRKKKFRDGSDGPKMVFKTLLSNAAIKKYGRLMKFSHFWWFDFLIFQLPKNTKNRIFKKCKIFIFFFDFHQFLLVFHVSLSFIEFFRFLG